MSGAFFVNRGVFDRLDELFADEPYSEREAWIWLFGNAVWKATKIRVKNHMVPLERGQLAFSVRFLAEKWKWKKHRVERFFNLLKNEDMIRTQPGHDITVITICNYDKYQLTPGYKPDATRTQSRTPPGHNPDKEESLNNSNKKYISRASRSETNSEFEEVRAAYPKRTPASPPKPARLKYEAARKRGVPHETILNGARAYAADCDRLERTGTQYVQRLDVWINQEGWSAYEAQPTGPPLPDDPIARRDQIWKEIEEENAKRAAESASRNLLAGGFRLGEEKQPQPERPRVVRSDGRDAKGDAGVVELFSEPSRVSASGDEDADRRKAVRIPLPRSMA